MDIYHACIRGNYDQVKELLSQGADPTCQYGIVEGVALLLQDGRADPTVANNYPIRVASEYGYTKIVSLLLQDGRADPTVYDHYSLEWACHNGHIDIVSLLLEDGRVDPTVNNDWIIRFTREEEIKEMLIAYKYRVDGKEYCKLKSDLALLDR
jgi:ankyrin repeat protein